MNKNVTLSTDATLLGRARKRAEAEGKTLNELFREWLTRYTAQPGAEEDYAALMRDMKHIKAERTFTREEMNERR